MHIFANKSEYLYQCFELYSYSILILHEITLLKNNPSTVETNYANFIPETLQSNKFILLLTLLTYEKKFNKFSYLAKSLSILSLSSSPNSAFASNSFLRLNA